MDENTSSTSDSSISEGTTPAEAMNTTGDSSQPAGDTSAENDSQPQTPSEGNPEPTGPAPETTDPDLPDHGINPDKGIDPDAGDLPTNPDPPLDSQQDDNVDLKSMSRAERAAYFQQQGDQLRRQSEQAIDQAYQPQEYNELVDEFRRTTYEDENGDLHYYSEAEARLLARDMQSQQKQQIADARAQVAELNSGMAIEAMELVNTIPWLNNANKDTYDQASIDAGSKLYDTLAITRDERTGQITEAKLSPKQFWTAINQIRESGAKQARLEGQKAAERQMAAVAPPSSNSTKRETPFDSLSASDMRAQLLAKGVNVT